MAGATPVANDVCRRYQAGIGAGFREVAKDGSPIEPGAKPSQCKVREEESDLSKTVFREDSCKSCELCLAVCPQKIIYITDRMNRQGYKSAGIKEEDMEKCLGCAVCARICPDTVIEVYKEAK